MSDAKYCGMGDVPKGKKRGTAEYCLNKNQVRYYGIKKIDKDLLGKKEVSKIDINKERLLLKRYRNIALAMVNDFKKQKLIANNDNFTAAERRKADKKMDVIIERKNEMMKKINSQKARILRLEAKLEKEGKLDKPLRETEDRKKASTKKKTSAAKKKADTTKKKTVTKKKTDTKKKASTTKKKTGAAKKKASPTKKKSSAKKK